MEKRLVSTEFNALKCFAAAISEILYARTDLANQLKLVDGGPDRLRECSENLNKLFDDLLGTIPEKQLKALKNAVSDYKFTLVPKYSPESKSIVIDKEYAKALIELAQAECKTCVKTPAEAESCPIFQSSIGVVPPSTYESFLCPYCRAEWDD